MESPSVVDLVTSGKIRLANAIGLEVGVDNREVGSAARCQSNLTEGQV